jgi:hypothetical protein
VTLALNKCVAYTQPFVTMSNRCSEMAICKEMFMGGALQLKSNLKQECIRQRPDYSILQLLGIPESLYVFLPKSLKACTGVTRVFAFTTTGMSDFF